MLRRIALLLVAVVALGWPAAVTATVEPATVKCRMTFTLKGWSAFYKTANGSGTVTCSNGQTFPVRLKVRGGGVTFGKIEILKGKGTFSAVKSVDLIFGHYAAAEAAAGASKAAQAAVYTKGKISLALTGTGSGFTLGFDFARLGIERSRK